MFSADWLALREPEDFEARSRALTSEAVGRLADAGRTLRALDLACGTGSNARYIAEQVGIAQEWLLVDHDAGLLDLLPARMAAWADARGAQLADVGAEICVTRAGHQRASFRAHRADLLALDDEAMFERRGLVTASALLDLVSESWVQQLARRCREANASALFALTYDGRIGFQPEEPEDETVRRLVNEHQRTAKGFGPALGPSAVNVVQRRFAEVGYQVRRERSDWVLSARGSNKIQQQLIEGWAVAATEVAPAQAAAIAAWLRRRLIHVDEGASNVTVGHEDIALWL